MNKFPKNNVLILLVGKSGSGKTTIAKKSGLEIVKSLTTRPKRFEGEDDYFFLSEEQFEYVEEHNDLLAPTTFNGYKYAVLRSEVKEKDIYILDLSGAKELKPKYIIEGKKLIVIYLKSNCIVRLWRMITRGDGIIKAISRIVHDHSAFKQVREVADFTITNNHRSDLKSCSDALKALVCPLEV